MDYSRLSQNCLEEIHFVDIDQAMVDLMISYFKSIINDGVIPVTYFPEKYVKQDATHNRHTGKASGK